MTFDFARTMSQILKRPTRRTSAKPKSSWGDRWLVIATVLLTLFGIIMVYDSSVAIAIRDFGDQYHFVRDQLRWLAVGYVAFILCCHIDYHVWYKLSLPLLIVSLLLLSAVFLPGIGIRAYGAHRWVNFGVFVLQPAELAKLSLIIYLGAWFSARERGRFLAFLLLLGMVAGLVLIEPDLGTSVIIIAMSVIFYFFSGSNVFHLLFLVPIIIGAIVVLAVVSPYRVSRITTFLHPETDPLGASYQIRQVLLGLGSGGWLGLGVGQSRQKYEYLPEANTDSIFAIIGEEVGFVGASGIILIYLFLVWRLFRIARSAPDRFGMLISSGVGALVGVQAGINLAAMVTLLPLTGVPLPLISYGGSGLVIMLTALGIVYNVSRSQA